MTALPRAGLPLTDVSSSLAGCDWCGLPVPGSASSRHRPDYCCYGCRLAHAIAEEKGDAGHVRWTVIRLGLSIFFTMNLMAFTMTMWSLDVYDVQPDPFQTKLFEVFRWLSMTLTVPVLMLLGLPMLRAVMESGRSSSFFADALIVLGVTTAAIVSGTNVVRGHGPIYFEVCAMVLVMVTLGRWLEAEGRQKATAALDELSALLPSTIARITGPEGRTEEAVVPAAEGRVRDIVRVRAGERFPLDGIVELGESLVDEQIFTGESTPVLRRAGDPVLAGTVNHDGDLLVRVTAEYRRGSFGRLLDLMQRARMEQGHYQRLAERVATWFLPAVILIAAVTLAYHWSVSGFGEAVQNSLSVLLIACPCALGLATPLAVWTTLSTAIRRQVLFRNGSAIERLAGIRMLCTDKTGTLTTGEPQVAEFTVGSGFRRLDALQLCSIAAASSSHPFSLAVRRYCDSEPERAGGTSSGNFPSARSSRTVSGRGVDVELSDGRTLRLGHPDFVAASFASHPELQAALDSADGAVVAAAVDEDPIAVVRLYETTRPEAPAMLMHLRSLGIPVTLLTGDRSRRATAFVQSLVADAAASAPDADAWRTTVAGADRSSDTVSKRDASVDVFADLSPEQKLEHIRRLRRDFGSVGMLGDGINDAPALASADVGIALGCGSDIARESAQVCLLSNNLENVAWAVRQAQQTRRIIRQNLFWAFGYNALGVVAASLGWLNPAVAAALMIVSSLLVVSNSVRLLNSGKSEGISSEPFHSKALRSDNQCDRLSQPSA